MSRWKVLDLFAGAGGVDEGCRMLGLTSNEVLGVETDKWCNATAVQAGHSTRLQANVLDLPADDGRLSCEGLWLSPPCQAWSMAGRRTAEVDRGVIYEHVERVKQDGWVAYDRSDYHDERTPPVLEVLRWAFHQRPKWVIAEQVRPVLALWERYREVLEQWGYRADADVLNAADYGVPQTRKRAILVARRDDGPLWPEPTHSKDGGDGLKSWVTMAEALGWDEETHIEWVSNHRPNAARRSLDQPAGTIFFGNDAASMKWRMMSAGRTGEGRPRDPETQPAATITGKGTAAWVHDRPSTTIVGSFRPDVVAAPGWRKPGDGPRQNAEGSVRVTPEQAAVLQSFPADYPWQGAKTRKFKQIGDAVPPLLAARLIGTRIDEEAVA